MIYYHACMISMYIGIVANGSSNHYSQTAVTI